MGVQRYKSGAWVVPTMKRYKNGAWVDITSIKRYINGAWSEIWKTTPAATFFPEGTTFVDPSVTTYGYTIADGGATLNFNIKNAVAGGNSVCFRISKSGGFGKSVKLKYTITQTMTASAYASTVWYSTDFVPVTRELGMWYNYQPATNVTYEGTKTFEVDQTNLYFIFEAYSNDITGTISNIYINDELVTFR